METVHFFFLLIHMYMYILYKESLNHSTSSLEMGWKLAVKDMATIPDFTGATVGRRNETFGSDWNSLKLSETLPKMCLKDFFTYDMHLPNHMIPNHRWFYHHIARCLRDFPFLRMISCPPESEKFTKCITLLHSKRYMEASPKKMDEFFQKVLLFP